MYFSSPRLDITVTTMPLAANLSAVAQDAATQINFRLPRPISVKAGHSFSVRFLNREIPADRIALYQPETHTRHPLAAIRIKNSGKSGLPPGALTFYELETGRRITSD